MPHDTPACRCRPSCTSAALGGRGCGSRPATCPQTHINGDRRPGERGYNRTVAFLITRDSPDYGTSRSPPLPHAHPGRPGGGGRQRLVGRGGGFRTGPAADAAFSHTTAAQIGGLPLPPDPAQSLHVTVPGSRGTRKGIVWHKGDLEGKVEVYRGLRITRPLPTWHALGRLLPLKELVVVADHLLRRRMVTLEELHRVPRMRHCRILRQAAALADGRSKSPQESRIRLEMRDRGFPTPELNLDIIEERGWIGNGDFVWREYRTIADYDGEVHRDEKQHTQDNQTRDLYAAYGWRHVALTKRMVRNMDAALGTRRPGTARQRVVRLITGECCKQCPTRQRAAPFSTEQDNPRPTTVVSPRGRANPRAHPRQHRCDRRDRRPGDPRLHRRHDRLGQDRPGVGLIEECLNAGVPCPAHRPQGGPDEPCAGVPRPDRPRVRAVGGPGAGQGDRRARLRRAAGRHVERGPGTLGDRRTPDGAVPGEASKSRSSPPVPTPESRSMCSARCKPRRPTTRR